MTPTIEFEGSIIAFRLYAEWVYSGSIQKKLLKVKGSGAQEDICFHNIGQAYILGDKLQDYKFKNAIVDVLLDTIVTHGKMDLTLPTLVFDKCFIHAPLRRLLVDIYVLYGHKDWLKPSNEITISAVFLSDLSTAFLARNSRDELSTPDNVSVLSVYKYHEHPDGKFCLNVKSHPREIIKTKP
jgi:hypothetical protein